MCSKFVYVEHLQEQQPVVLDKEVVNSVSLQSKTEVMKKVDKSQLGRTCETDVKRSRLHVVDHHPVVLNQSSSLVRNIAGIQNVLDCVLIRPDTYVETTQKSKCSYIGRR